MYKDGFICCHSERSEESQPMSFAIYLMRSFASLRMTILGMRSAIILPGIKILDGFSKKSIVVW